MECEVPDQLQLDLLVVYIKKGIREVSGRYAKFGSLVLSKDSLLVDAACYLSSEGCVALDKINDETTIFIPRSIRERKDSFIINFETISLLG